ncbi:MAG: FAD-dependent oxidoreductase [Lachnospiraceae bacterium]|nr:FAD-dependent oxidoreductase [Lachnospiraceae bacterium]
MNKYVIIGNGVAACGCVEGIRSYDKEGSITIISEENHPVYSRPLISYYLEDKTDLKRMLYRDEDFYEKNKCKVYYNKKAVKVDKEEKSVTLDDSTIIYYDKLCVAAGSRPFVPPFKGLETVKNKFSFMKLDDALEIEKVLSKKARVLIVGAGLIGLKCAEGIYDKVRHITICDLAPRLLSSILDEESEAIVRKTLIDKDIDLMLGDTAESFDTNKAFMKSGKTVEFDILVLAVGVRANTELLSEEGIACGRGIVVNDRQETSVKGIFAAGDCTEYMDISSNQQKVMAILPNAYMQGKCAGSNMVGIDCAFDDAFPMNSMGIFGTHMMTAGCYCREEDGGEVYIEKSDDKLKKLFMKDGYLKGFILVNDIKKAGIYTSMIRNQVPLDTVDFNLVKTNPELIAFGVDYVKEKMTASV